MLAERGICPHQGQPRIRVPVECRQGGCWENQGRPSGNWGKQEVKTLAQENLGAMVFYKGHRYIFRPLDHFPSPLYWKNTAYALDSRRKVTENLSTELYILSPIEIIEEKAQGRSR